MFEQDPFSGHVVIRSTDGATPGSHYKLWTTLKIPGGYSMTKHCDYLSEVTGAEKYLLMPAKRLFALGVGHVRRRELAIGSKADEPAEVLDTQIVELSPLDWQVLTALKRELEPEEIRRDVWQIRAVEAGVPLETFPEIADSLNKRKVIGRFSTFLEHVKATAGDQRVTRYNALFPLASACGPRNRSGAGRSVALRL